MGDLQSLDADNDQLLFALKSVKTNPKSPLNNMKHNILEMISTTQGPYERRDTIATPSAAPRPYRGFPSEAHYLAALREWAESKKYLDAGTTLIGFYGEKSMEDYSNRPGLEMGSLGLKKKWKARKEKKAEQQAARRNTVT